MAAKRPPAHEPVPPSPDVPDEPEELALWRDITREWDRLARQVRGADRWVRQTQRLAARARARGEGDDELDAELMAATEAETAEARLQLSALREKLVRRKATSGPPKSLRDELRERLLLWARDLVAAYMRDASPRNRDRALAAVDTIAPRAAAHGVLDLDNQIVASRELRKRGNHPSRFVAANVIAKFADLGVDAPKFLLRGSKAE